MASSNVQASGNVALQYLRLSWYLNCAHSEAIDFAKNLGFDLDDEDEPSHWSASFAALPESPAKGELYLSGGMHATGKEPDQIHWDLALRKTPSDKPPEQILELSEKMGGLSNVMHRILESYKWNKTVEIEFRATFILDAKRWRPVGSSKKGKGSRKRLAIGTVARQNSSGWDLEPPIEGINQLVQVFQTNGLFSVSASGNKSVDLSDKLLNNVESEVRHSLTRLLGEG